LDLVVGVLGNITDEIVNELGIIESQKIGRAESYFVKLNFITLKIQN